jgi:hypothetical protein
MHGARMLAAAAAVILLAGPARPAEPPDVVRKALAEARADCIQFGGKPGRTDAIASVEDLDGDGGEDWILDFSKFECAGIPPPFCGSGGCSLQIFLFQGGGRWQQVFDDVVRGFRRVRVGGRAGLQISFHGSVCNRPGYQPCRKTYVFERGRMRLR